MPSLYLVDIESNKQTKITNSPSGKGDYDPQYIKSIDKLVWFSESLNGKRDIWIANPDGSKAKEWMKNVETIHFSGDEMKRIRVENSNLQLIGKDERWLQQQLEQLGYTKMNNIFYAAVRDIDYSSSVDTGEGKEMDFKRQIK